MQTNHCLLCILICAGLFLPSRIDASQRRPSDFLALPTQDSLPTSLQAVTDLLPTYVGSANDRERLEWEAPCFRRSSAWLEFHNKSGSQFGGGTLHLEVNNAATWTCLDLYVFATPFSFFLDFYIRRGQKEVDFYEWKSEAEYNYVKRRGIQVLVFKSGLENVVKAFFEVYPMLALDESGEKANIAFLEKYMGASFEERPRAAWVTHNINPDDIQSGDFIVFSRFRGPSGVFHAFQKWATGSYGGHTAVCLRDPQGKLWVAESGVTTKDGEEIIAIVPWEGWWEYVLTKDESNAHVGLLPLRHDIRAKFNEAAAWEFATSLNASLYGFQNVIFSWIDTIADNYPPPVDADLVGQFMNIFNQIMPSSASKLWDEALNLRLGTEGLSLPEIMEEIEKRGLSFAEVLAIPEKDDWDYSQGKSVSCVAYIIQIYKAAGIFDDLTSSIQGTEFTVKDGYILKVYEDDLSRLPKWCNEGDTVKLPYCQIRGNYRLELPGYNTIEPYAGMNENCPSLPTEYYRPQGC